MGMILITIIGTVTPTPQPDSIDQLVGPRLAERDIRYTAARRFVVRALNTAPGPLTAAELYEQLRPDVPLSSLYRTLTVLADSGVLDRQHDGDGLARFELSEWLKGHHHHLVCKGCGAVTDVAIGHGLEEQMDVLIRELADEQGWTATGHRIDIEGMCPACRR